MTRLEIIIQMTKIALMVLFLGIVAWTIANGGVPVRIVG
jgi:hypothetical protein